MSTSHTYRHDPISPPRGYCTGCFGRGVWPLRDGLVPAHLVCGTGRACPGGGNAPLRGLA